VTPLAEAAAFLAPSLAVFPCDVHKRPLTPRGLYDATRDPDTARRLFSHPAAALIGVPTGADNDVFAVDLDTKRGAPGLEWLAANRHRLPPTRTHSTPSGGLHLLFRYPAGRNLRNSASKIAPGVDVRAQGGYVCAPPSPGYEITDAASPAPAPAWLLGLIDPPAAPPAPPAPYTPPSLDRVTRYAEAALDAECRAVASAGEGGRNHQLNVSAVKLGGLVAAGALSESVVRAELRRAALHAGLEPRETDLTIQSGLSYGMQQPRQIPERVAYQAATTHVPPSAPASVSGEPIRADAPRGLPLIYWPAIVPSLGADDFVEGVLIDRQMSVIYGPSNCGKTFWTSDLAMHVATGRKWNGREIEAGGVIYCALEGAYGIQNRVAAWRGKHDLEGVEVPFAIIPVALNLLDPSADTDRVLDAIDRAKHDMGVPVRWIIMDTLSRAMAGGNENSPEDMGALVTNGTKIQQVGKAHVSWIHHSGKDQAQGARGHSLLRAATDTEIEISRPDKDSPSTARVTKQREMEIEGDWRFRLEPVELGQNRRGKPVTSCIVVPDTSEAAAPRKRMSADTARAFEVLASLIAEDGQTGHRAAPDGCASVPDQWWRDRFYQRAKPGADQDTKKRAFRRAADNLLELQAIGMEGGRVWLI
jgi:hypothetical protein